MPHEVSSATVSVLIWLIGLIFGAGGMYFSLKQMRRDVNGLGRKVNETTGQNAKFHVRLCIALVLLSPKEEQWNVAKFLTSDE